MCSRSVTEEECCENAALVEEKFPAIRMMTAMEKKWRLGKWQCMKKL